MESAASKRQHAVSNRQHAANALAGLSLECREILEIPPSSSEFSAEIDRTCKAWRRRRRVHRATMVGSASPSPRLAAARALSELAAIAPSSGPSPFRRRVKGSTSVTDSAVQSRMMKGKPYDAPARRSLAGVGVGVGYVHALS